MKCLLFSRADGLQGCCAHSRYWLCLACISGIFPGYSPGICFYTVIFSWADVFNFAEGWFITLPPLWLLLPRSFPSLEWRHLPVLPSGRFRVLASTTGLCPTLDWFLVHDVRGTVFHSLLYYSLFLYAVCTCMCPYMPATAYVERPEVNLGDLGLSFHRESWRLNLGL